jgi:hypothetical protein
VHRLPWQARGVVTSHGTRPSGDGQRRFGRIERNTHLDGGVQHLMEAHGDGACETLVLAQLDCFGWPLRFLPCLCAWSHYSAAADRRGGSRG